MSSVSAEVSAAYREAGWWVDDTVSDAVARNAKERADKLAYSDNGVRLTWSEFDRVADALARDLVSAGAEPGDRVAFCLSDSVHLHTCFVAAERAGVTIVGLGARAGRREIRHLLGKVAARILVTGPMHAGAPSAELVSALAADEVVVDHLILEGAGREALLTRDGKPVRDVAASAVEMEWRRAGPDDLYLINSTSGTTGLPKSVAHTQNRWHYFHQQALANGMLGSAEVVLAAVPAPFGFGIWTSHVTPIRLGAHTVLLERFTPGAAFAAIERERVTVLCCVSTQFMMMLADPTLDDYDLSSLRVVYTGGEAVPYAQALEFERRTGATILQFYGSNETGLLSGTTVNDSPEKRLRTAGRIVPEMQVRLFEGDRDVTDSGRGQPACKGPATSTGYLGDAVANAELYTADGWMLMGDICEIDQDGYLSVVGRLSDFVVRGGKNISLTVVEADLLGHPAVAQAAAVGMPDPVFGERVCAYVALHPGESLSLEELTAFLADLGISKELYPERLIVVDELPRSSGAKVAKGELRADIELRLRAENAAAVLAAST